MTKWATKVATIVVVLAVPLAIASSQREPTILRTVRGTVIDTPGKALPSSVVYLRHHKSGDVRTRITEGNGQYRFSGLHPHADYEIQARHGDWISSVYKLYGADGKTDLVLDLKVYKKQKATLLIRVDRAIGSISARAPEQVRSRPIITRSGRSERAKAWSSVQLVARNEGGNTPPLG